MFQARTLDIRVLLNFVVVFVAITCSVLEMLVLNNVWFLHIVSRCTVLGVSLSSQA